MITNEKPIRKYQFWLIFLMLIICLLLPIISKIIIDEDNKTCYKKLATEFNVENDYREIGKEYEQRIIEIFSTDDYSSGIKKLEQYGKVYELTDWYQIKNEYTAINISINPCNLRTNGFYFTIIYFIDGGFKDAIVNMDD